MASDLPPERASVPFVPGTARPTSGTGALLDAAAPAAPAGRDGRAVAAVTLAGVGAFLNIYATQPLLPLFERLFHASKADAGRTVSATTLGVALSAPFCGMLAERLGHRRVIVAATCVLALPTLLAATSTGLGQLVLWRFLQGVVTPGIFAVTIACITEEWPGDRVPRVMSIYVSGTVLGGFLGRWITGVAATHLVIPGIEPSWRVGFVLVSILDVAFGCLLWRWLPRDSAQTARRAERGSMLRHLRNPRLVATYAVGFNVLFTLVATFTYITFHLAAAPFSLRPAALSTLFVVYLVGLVITPLGGVWISRVGSRTALIGAVLGATAGVLLTLIPHLPVIVLGLVLCSSGAFVCQAASTSYIQREAPAGERSSVAGLYVTSYYVGGSVAGVAPGVLWAYGQWTSCVLLVVAVQAVTVVIAAMAWKGGRASG